MLRAFRQGDRSITAEEIRRRQLLVILLSRRRASSTRESSRIPVTSIARSPAAVCTLRRTRGSSPGRICSARRRSSRCSDDSPTSARGCSRRSDCCGWQPGGKHSLTPSPNAEHVSERGFTCPVLCGRVFADDAAIPCSIVPGDRGGGVDHGLECDHDAAVALRSPSYTGAPAGHNGPECVAQEIEEGMGRPSERVNDFETPA